MKRNSLICGTINGIANEISCQIEDKGFNVIKISASQLKEDIKSLMNELDSLDMLVYFALEEGNSKQRTIRDGLDYEDLMSTYEENTINFLRIVEYSHELMMKSSLRRICIVTSSNSSINFNSNSCGYGCSMSQAAINNLVQMLMNRYQKENFTFRMMCTKYYAYKEAGIKAARNAVTYFLRNRAYDIHTNERNDENRLALRDIYGREIPW
ncbi:MAG TPA: hypothetical protein VIK78_22815 [Ruminiclostridium sp.]